MNKIGFMQGRLSNLVNNQIQAFPFEDWTYEFELAKKIGFDCMEWTLDYPNLHNNPLLIPEKKKEIELLSKSNNIEIQSITLDCCMQRPFWKERNTEIRNKLIKDFKLIINSSIINGIKLLVLPLVDNGSINNLQDGKLLIKILNSLELDLKKNNIMIAFESDYAPSNLLDFINQFDKISYGINYDIGNSASLGFDTEKELDLYGDRIINVHVKDRVLNGNTVRLGKGNADFEKVFQGLSDINYQENFILQTARSIDNNHFGELEINYNFLKKYIF
tara:strand:+ start:1788 stop:2615 length:828 start_codon:yes stop_codon:yes gene_type:complete